MDIQFSVFTLNVWGIYWVSKDRVARIEAIAEELATGKYQFVFLQEVWCKSDYIRIKNKVQTVLPHSHYFHNGIIGSGLCIFSATEIMNILYHPWTVNGYMHKVQHGDWFGGKGIGLCEVVYNGARICLYTSHLHAEYDRKNDEYLSHRVAQAWEASQFIKMTSRDADMVVLGGDLNSEPQDVSLNMFIQNSGLSDAWKQVNQDSDDVGGTCDTPTNSYHSSAVVAEYPGGKRIDYILHKAGYGKKVETLFCTTPLPSRAPGLEVSYSDHEAVVAKLKLVNHVPDGKTEVDRDALVEIIKESMNICDQGAKKVCDDKFFWGKLAFLCLACLLSFNMPGGILTTLLICFLLAFFLIMATLWNYMEENGLIARKLEMEAMYNYLKNTRSTSGVKNQETYEQ